jgi:predicted small lipoprotein YifL
LRSNRVAEINAAHYSARSHPMKMNFPAFSLVLLLAFPLTGCDQKPPAAATPPPDEGRANTKVLEAAGLVGYDGKKLRQSTDRVLDVNDRRNQEIERTLGNEEP